MPDFAQRLRQLRTDKDLTQSDFGALFNLSKQTISGYEKGDNTPPIDTLQRFASFFNVSTDYLLGRSRGKAISEEYKSIPLLGKIRAGVPLLGQINWDSQITPPEGIEAEFAAEVAGDSMIYAGIHPGDIAFFVQTSTPSHGQIVATRVTDYESEVNLKFFINKNGQPLLRSANPEYEDIIVTPHHAVVGVLVGLVRDGAPALPDYERLLTLKEDHESRWVKAIEEVTAAGLKPEQVVQLIGIMKSFVGK